MSEKELYRNSSGVDMDFMYSTYDEARAIGYDGEFSLFKCLLNNQMFEHAKILTNLVIPTGVDNRTTEIDMLFITEYGIIVFEVKNYKGTIYGKPEDKYWTQYFRTVSNQKFVNPIKQNEYHIIALRKLVCEPIFSIIYFSNPECNITNVCSENLQCAVINDARMSVVLHKISLTSKEISVDRIDEIFQELKKYSKLEESPRVYSENVIFDINAFVEEANLCLQQVLLENEKQHLEKSADDKRLFKKKIQQELVRNKADYQKQLEEYKISIQKTERKKYMREIIPLAIVCGILAIISIWLFFVAADSQEKMNFAVEQYESMSKKFSQVSESDIELADSIVEISNVTITPHDYLEGSYLRFTLTNVTGSATLCFSNPNEGNSVLLLILKNGDVEEYKLKSTSPLYGNFGESNKTRNFEFVIAHSADEIQEFKLSPIYVKSGFEFTHSFTLRVWDFS